MEPDARDHLGRVGRADVDDLRDVEVEGEAVPRAHGDRGQLRVVGVGLGAVRPVEHDVGGGHQLHLHHARVERVLARVERRHPHALVAGVHQVAVLEVGAAHVLVRLAHEGDDDAHVADGDLRHGHLLHLHEPGVEVPRAGQQHLLLQAAPAAARPGRPARSGSCRGPAPPGPAISPASMGAPSSVVTMPTRSGSTRYTRSASRVHAVGRGVVPR